MATNKKGKAAPAKNTRKPVKPAAARAAAKVQPKKAAAPSAKPSPAKAPRKPAALPKPVAKPTPQKKPLKKGAPAPKPAPKDLSKKIVKTAVVAKPLPKPVVKAAADPKKPRFSKSDLEQFKLELLAMRDRITGQSGSMRIDALQRTDEINPEEDGTDAFLRLQTLEQVSSQQHVVVNIDEALRAIEKGTYGVCDMCGELINKPRLSVLPFAKNCIKCQSEMERVRRPGGRR